MKTGGSPSPNAWTWRDFVAAPLSIVVEDRDGDGEGDS
jgi:hypothetical protein